MSLRPFYNTLILLLLSFLIYSYFTKIILFLVINRVFTLDVLPLIKKKWQENALMALVLQLMGNELLKEITFLLMLSYLMIRNILKSKKGESIREGIVLSIIIVLLMDRIFLINMIKIWQERVLITIVVKLMENRLFKDMFLFIIYIRLQTRIIFSSVRRKSAWKEIILAIIIFILVERNFLITTIAPMIIVNFSIKIMPKLSLEFSQKEMYAHIIVTNLLRISNIWIELRLIIIIIHLLIIIIYFLIKIYLRNLRIRRMITMDRDLNIDERKEKYRSREIICEKNWKHVINHYHCMDCLDEKTDDKEKAHLRYGICKECSQPNTGSIIWCSFCNIKYLQQDFDKWTSENEDIDELIKNSQLKASSTNGIIEWIPYNKFTNIKYVATGGFAKVYSANWIDGYIRGWDLETKNWKRKKQKKVALKELNDSSKDISKGFLNEVSKRKQKGNLNLIIY